MDDKLLVRVYNVGLGDCIYVRVPDAGGAKHLLIDCGNKYGKEEDLAAAITDLKRNLPEVPGEPGRRRLDLLVATHAHEDHVRGFSTDLFAGIQIERLWMSAAMDPEHPQAENTRALKTFALAALERLRLSARAGLSEWAQSMLALSKAEGMEALVDKLPVGRRRYVHAASPPAELQLFDGADARLRVLAPMADIDGIYLGRETATALHGLQALSGAGLANAEEAGERPATASEAVPANVSREDFDLLRRSLSDQSLAFVLKAGELVNNTSVVLLLEWRGRRLLFTGDAEVKTSAKGAFQKDRANGSWNVMWHNFREALSEPVDFLKVGHHGSHNATPWTGKKSGDAAHPVNAILDSLLPLPTQGTAPETRYAVVSTARTNGYPTIPDPALMIELGKRASNLRSYQESADKKHFVPAGHLQPQRTDLESSAGERVPWIDVELSAKP